MKIKATFNNFITLLQKHPLLYANYLTNLESETTTQEAMTTTEEITTTTTTAKPTTPGLPKICQVL